MPANVVDERALTLDEPAILLTRNGFALVPTEFERDRLGGGLGAAHVALEFAASRIASTILT